MHFFIGYGQLVFRMYSQEIQAGRALLPFRVPLEQSLWKNYLDDESLLNKICELKIFWVKNKKRTFVLGR